MTERSRRDELHNEYWSTIRSANPKAAITLEDSNAASDVEFHLYGVRIAERFTELMRQYGSSPLAWSSIIDIGCGVGRFALPFAGCCQHVYAVDISDAVLEEARTYCRSMPNISYHRNDGETLSDFDDNSIDYGFCGGVLQHVKYFDVISSYFCEAIRVLRIGGVFTASFQVWQTEEVGTTRVGAKVTARKLNEALSGAPYEICHILFDPKDPVPHYLVVLRKTAEVETDNPARDFSTFAVDHNNFRTGVFEDLPSCNALVERWKDEPRPVTFYDD
ncbi:MAG: class I SAM-dependent methyltransferase [Pseudomonadota bacterium]